MINIKVVRLYSSDFGSGETRLGDTQIITDGTYVDVIDGYCGNGAIRLINELKSRDIKSPYLHITHAHYDHDYGILRIINNSYFSPKALYCYDPDSLKGGFSCSEVKSDAEYLRKVINAAKSKGIPVKYIGDGDTIDHGDIHIKVYRRQPSYKGTSSDSHGWAYLNEGSLCYWFPELRYLTTGDASMWSAYKYGFYPLIIKGGHHGNDISADEWLSPSKMGVWLYNHGCRYYWDNDFSTKLTDFLMTGRDDAINAGMTILNIHSAISMTFADGKVTIKNGSKTYTASVPYNGKAIIGTWVKDNSGWRYRYADASYAIGWAFLKWTGGTHWFYFNGDGYMLTGWHLLTWSGGKHWFYFDSTNGNMLTGMHKLKWSKGENYFLFDSKNGNMLTGWQYAEYDNRKGWFYLDKTSGAAKIGWFKDNGYWYYFANDGFMMTGWIDYDGKRCYLETKSGNYLGHAYCNQTATIDGKTYRFDSNCYVMEGVVTGDITTVTGKLNSMSASRKQFVIDIANYVRKYAPQYGICVYSPIIAQAIHESGWGESSLAAKYHNYFGMKCGTKWSGKSVNLSTKEEYSAGSLTTISANFRAYDSMEEGVKGYFEFIQLPRYANLKGVTSPRQYLTNIKNDGYATGSKYVDNTMNLINLYSLTQFDVPITATPTQGNEKTSTADPIEVMIQIAKAEVGYHEGANNHTKYGDEMHSIQPRNMDKNAAWCDAFCDWVILQTCKAFGYGADMAREVLCGDFDDYTYSSVNLYKKANRWTQTPSKGHQIFFGGSGHTGMVIDVVGNTVYTIEGNKSDQVKECSYAKSNSNIIGYGMPRYELLGGEISADNLPLLKRGSTGYFVLHLQKMLNKADYAGKQTLEEDGSFGALTEAQVKLYQKDRGLEADGEVGHLTWGALYS